MSYYVKRNNDNNIGNFLGNKSWLEKVTPRFLCCIL